MLDDFVLIHPNKIRMAEVKKKVLPQGKRHKRVSDSPLDLREDSQDDVIEEWAQAKNMGFQNNEQWGNTYTGSQWIKVQQQLHKSELIDLASKKNVGKDCKQTYLEFEKASPALSKEDQALFQDKQFPPVQLSLTGEWGQIPKYKDVNWERASKNLANCTIFRQKISHKDTTQGKLGDCYFLAAIAALAERPDRIFNLFLVRQINSRKYFSVKILYKGRWRVIDLDEYFPFLQGKPVFSRAKREELWVMILEKAWAKLYSNYMRISAGNAEQPLHDLTGAPLTFYKLKDKALNKEKLWKYLLKASKRQYAMCASSNAGSDEKLSQSGIVLGHAYTLLNATYLQWGKQKVRLLQMRNPWGRKEGSGSWNDRDPKWKTVSQQERKRISFKPKDNDGIFFMEFQDFLREYRSLVVAEVNDNASYVYQTGKDPNSEGVWFKVTLLDSARYSFQVDKPPKRSFTVKEQQGYKYPEARVRIFSQQSGYQKIHNFSDNERLTSRAYNLEKGIYIVNVLIDFDTKRQKQYDVTLAIYSEGNCIINLATVQQKKKVEEFQTQVPIKLKLKNKSRSVPKPSSGSQNETVLKAGIKFHYVDAIKPPQNPQPKSIPISTIQYSLQPESPESQQLIPEQSTSIVSNDNKVNMQVKNRRGIVHLGGKAAKQIPHKAEENAQNWGNHLEGKQWVKEQQKQNNGSIFQAMEKDIGDLIKKQIVYIEPSPSKNKLQQLQAKKKDFIDDRFPPSIPSLCGQWGNLQEWKNVRWERISKVMPKSIIFQGKVSPCSIKQGFLGDCYFLAGLAALAERPHRIFNLFLLTERNQVNFYSVKLMYRGKWMTIDLDDFIPYMYEFPAFSSAAKDELWVILLQKAWAKLYGSFKRIEAGFPQQTLHDLTGAPIRHIYLTRSSFNPEAEWLYLMKASQLQYAMVASSQAGADSLKSVKGIVQGHAYTLLKVVMLKFNQGVRLVQLRNPWGKGEGSDSWADSDPNWNLISPEEKARVGFTRADDGIFFMTYQCFCREFKLITVAEINDNASYVYKSFRDMQSRGGYFKLQILQKGQYSLQVDTTPERTFQYKYNSDYRCPNVHFELGRLVDKGYVQRMATLEANARTLFNNCNLQVGVYIVFVQIAFDDKYEKDYEVNLACYGDYACKLSLASNRDAVIFSNNPNVIWDGEESPKSELTILRSYKPDKARRA